MNHLNIAIFIILSAGYINKTIKNIASDPDKRLIGTWEYVEMRNMNGEKITSYKQSFGTVLASGPEITFLADGTFKKKFLANNIQTGLWQLDDKAMIINYDLYIDSTDFVGKDLIKKGLAVKQHDGNYYERISTQILHLMDSELILYERGNQVVYKLKG